MLELSKLRKENAYLKSQLTPKKTSNNSSIPPSKDENRAKRNSSLRKKSGKKTGGQPGHKGSNLKMSAHPDKVIKIIPDYCNECGKDLSAIEAILSSKRQVVDLRVVKPLTTEYQSHSKSCNCGHIQKGGFPQGVTNHIQYGSNIEAIVSYLSVFQYVPFKRMEEMLSEMFNVSISQGTIANMLTRMEAKSESVYSRIASMLSKSKYVGADETGARVNGEKQWAWTWQNSKYTFITVSKSRGKQVVEAVFPDGFPNSYLGSDRWRPHLNTYAKGHQLCLAHLLRDVNYLIELKENQWANKIKTLFQKGLKLKSDTLACDHQDPRALAIEAEFDDMLKDTLEKSSAPKSLTFQKAMLTNRDHLWPFLYNKEIPADNNGSERAIRNFKVKLKISGQFKTGHQIFAKLRSVVDTCIKQNMPVLSAMKRIALNHIPAE